MKQYSFLILITAFLCNQTTVSANAFVHVKKKKGTTEYVLKTVLASVASAGCLYACTKFFPITCKHSEDLYKLTRRLIKTGKLPSGFPKKLQDLILYSIVTTLSFTGLIKMSAITLRNLGSVIS